MWRAATRMYAALETQQGARKPSSAHGRTEDAMTDTAAGRRARPWVALVAGAFAVMAALLLVVLGGGTGGPRRREAWTWT